jgi:proteic killer suppression protein
MVYLIMAINSFSDAATEELYKTGKTRKSVGWQSVINVALRKLDMIEYAKELDDLRSPPGNKLEKLKRNLSDFHSIRINNQWRVIFRWTSSGAEDVKICDYH